MEPTWTVVAMAAVTSVGGVLMAWINNRVGELKKQLDDCQKSHAECEGRQAAVEKRVAAVEKTQGSQSP